MNGLRSFRTIPQDVREWSRWMKAQDIPDPVSDTILNGSEVFSGTTPIQVIVNESTVNYSVFVDGGVNETFWITNKQLKSFNVNSSNSSSTASVKWMLVR